MKNLIGWIDARLPLCAWWRTHASAYYLPKNLNWLYLFGSLALVVLINQLLTGLWLAMSFEPSSAQAFASVEHIMRDVPYGWLIRYLHSTGASAFFVVLYLHIFRGLLYGSYRKPRELVWILGLLLYLVVMAEAFTGYLLPWGQMSYWGAQVITSLLEAIPVVGTGLTEWIRGDYGVSDVTLKRFFALHTMALPVLLMGLCALHIAALRQVGSSNPQGIEIKAHTNAQGIPIDGIPFHPYYSLKDLLGLAVFLVLFLGVVFFAPELGGLTLEPANFEPANPLSTPTHIAPSWYFTPFYAMLRAIPDKIGGIVAFGAAFVILFALPWLDRSPVAAMRYKGSVSAVFLTLFCMAFIMLGVLGTQAPNPRYLWVAQMGTGLYFAYFLLMPLYTHFEAVHPVPERIASR